MKRTATILLMPFGFLVLAVVPPVFLTGCGSQSSKPKTDQEILAELERKGSPEFQQAKAEYANPLQGIDQPTRQERLNALLTKFSVVKDEFHKRVTYRHKAFSRYYNANGTTLRAQIVGTTFYLDSAYVGDDWIFEKSFTVKVGDKQMTASDDSPKHDVDDGVVDELIGTYDARAVVMAELIANANGQRVRVRIAGEHYKDYTLPERYRKAIAETLELWKLLGGNSATWVPHSWLNSE